MIPPYAALIAETAAHTPPLDPDGFFEWLDVLDANLSGISDRPTKHELRVALHELCRANANTRFAELGLATRF